MPQTKRTKAPYDELIKVFDHQPHVAQQVFCTGELLLAIFGFLPTISLIRAMRICRYLNDVIRHENQLRPALFLQPGPAVAMYRYSLLRPGSISLYNKAVTTPAASSTIAECTINCFNQELIISTPNPLFSIAHHFFHSHSPRMVFDIPFQEFFDHCRRVAAIIQSGGGIWNHMLVSQPPPTRVELYYRINFGSNSVMTTYDRCHLNHGQPIERKEGVRIMDIYDQLRSTINEVVGRSWRNDWFIEDNRIRVTLDGLVDEFHRKIQECLVDSGSEDIGPDSSLVPVYSGQVR